ncbi:MAG: flagellin [Thermotoga sp.]|nr:flagellin [Thermotoga sp.]
MRIDNVSLVRYIEQLYPERTNRTVYRFNSVSELSIQQRLRSQIEGYRSTLSQIYSGIGLLNTADAGLESITAAIQRARELAVQASSSTLTENERSLLQEEYSRILQGIRRTIQQTTYNNRRILEGENLVVQTGPNEGQNITLNIPDLRETLSKLFETDISRDSQQALRTIDQVLEEVSQTRGNIGAWMNRLEASARNVLNAYSELFRSESTFEPAAEKAMMEQIRNELLRQVTITGLLYRMENSRNVLNLLM